MSDFINEFFESIEITKRLGLNFDPFFIDTERLFYSNDLYNSLKALLINEFPEFHYGGLGLKCHVVSFFMKPIVDKYLGIETILTVGYITLGNNDDRFYINEQLAKQMINSKNHNDIVRFHTWLTLPSTEILDFTLGNSFALANSKIPKAEYIFRHPMNLDSLTFHPIIIGEDFLIKTGFLKHH